MRIGILTIDGDPLVDGAGEYLGSLDDTFGLAAVAGRVAAFLHAEEAEYLGLIAQLLPSGWAWPRQLDSNLMTFATGIATGFARIHRKVVVFLVREADPRHTSDMLFDWERAFGLPDPCSSVGELVIEQRRSILVGKITGIGGQTPAFLRALAAVHGYTTAIEEFRRTTCVDPCTFPVYGPPWAHTFLVSAPDETITRATCVSLCTAPLRTWGNERLECVIRRAKPAHSIAIFSYN